VGPEAAASASRTAGKTREPRSDGRPRAARRVTCTGRWQSCGARRRCGTERRFDVGGRPAPARRPPQDRKAKLLCEVHAILNWAQFISSWLASQAPSSRWNDHVTGAGRGQRGPSMPMPEAIRVRGWPGLPLQLPAARPLLSNLASSLPTPRSAQRTAPRARLLSPRATRPRGTFRATEAGQSSVPTPRAMDGVRPNETMMPWDQILL